MRPHTLPSQSPTLFSRTWFISPQILISIPSLALVNI